MHFSGDAPVNDSKKKPNEVVMIYLRPIRKFVFFCFLGSHSKDWEKAGHFHLA